jgi:deoxyribodipyrimidine photo-lyase
MQVVWFKRDLRIVDHAPLVQAARQGPCLCLYVYEPELIYSAEFDTSHLQFINQALTALDERLHELGARMTYRVGNMVEVLDKLHAEFPVAGLWSHEETGNKVTFDRDLCVAKWARRNNVTWQEIPQNGVVRRLRSRDGWSKQRDGFMRSPVSAAPQKIDSPAGVASGSIKVHGDLGLPPSAKMKLQVGGEQVGHELLNAFLDSRGENYSTEMSSPVSAWNSCSRLSPYFAWGCLSMKTVVHTLRERQEACRAEKKSGVATGGWLKSLTAFGSRLSWHCHFMQKLEDEPAIEFDNMSRAYDGLREDSFKQNYFDAWCAGHTGYPMVDACMRALHKHSWINFRMRAMLVSFASYHLWLHWRQPAVFLAQHFLDFEPGIHFSQFQMQSGTTGINAVRIYSPIKQVMDQDPDGEFIRKFVPELSAVPKEFIAEPHKMPLLMQSMVGCRIGKDYPKPIVNHVEAYRHARERIYAVRAKAQARQDAREVMQRHGSRKGSTQRR